MSLTPLFTSTPQVLDRHQSSIPEVVLDKAFEVEGGLLRFLWASCRECSSRGKNLFRTV